MTYLYQTTALAAALGALVLAAPASAQEQSSVCDTAWTEVDTDGDGFVSKAEVEGSVETHFSQIDKDGDGNVTRIEYADCLASPAEVTAAAGERTEDAFAQADGDGDGSLSRDEFSTASETAFDDSRSADDDEALVVLRRYLWLTPEEASDEAMLRDMSRDEAASRSAMTFQSLDANGDDLLDTREWAESEPASARTEAWTEARFDSLDADSSGGVSAEEYSQARAEMLDEIETSSTSGGASADASSTDEATTSDAGDDTRETTGIPVYVYRFWTM